MLGRLKLARTSAFRYTALYTLAFMLGVAVIGTVTELAMSAVLERHAQRRVESETAALIDEYDHGGRPDLEAALRGRLRDLGTPLRYGYFGPGGATILGEAALAGAAEPGGGPAGLLARAHRLPDGTLFVVSDDLLSVREIRRLTTWAFGLALAGAMLVGLAAGAGLSSAILRRVDRVSVAAEAIIGGDLKRRIEIAGTGDDFDRLASTLNRMLDRIETLLEQVRQVSNDVAHDLRTPLARLRAKLEAASTKAGPGAPGLVDAIADLDNTLETFAAILRISQVEAGARRATFRDVDLSKLLSEVAADFEPVAETRGRRLRTRIDPDVHVLGDRELLIQLFVNLIENALRHTPAGTVCVAFLTRRFGSVVAAISDNGLGVPQGELPLICKRFYRVERSRTTPGSGLGLAMATAIAELHQAKLVLSDAAPGLRAEIVFTSETLSV